MRTAETALTAEPTPPIEHDPQDAMAHYNRGLACSEVGDYEQAIENFTRTIAVEPQNALAYYNRGAAYGNSGRHQRAIEDFDRAIELNPQDAGLRRQRPGAAWPSSRRN